MRYLAHIAWVSGRSPDYDPTPADLVHLLDQDGN